MRLQRNILAFAVSFFGICSAAIGQVNSPQAPPLPGSPGSIFVPLAPCRILNTRRDPPDKAASPGSRDVDIRATRCGRIVPPYALGFALRMVSFNTATPGVARTERPVTVPKQANGLFHFNASPDEELAVDVYGYYVAAGTPVDAMSAAGSVGSVTALSTSSTSAAPRIAGNPSALDVQPGTRGQIYLDASVSPFTSSGILMMAPNSASPWMTAKLSTTDAGSGFAVYSSTGTSALFQARGDGDVKLSVGTFLDGRTDYFGSSDSYYGFVAIPTNIVHDVTLIDPHDAAGGATTRVVFYNAQTDAEYGSPTVTKYRAFTDGWDSHAHINFDSQIGFHWPGNQLYHFRAFSAREGKDTFWVRPATDGDYQTNTRADMYVSGYVGVGTATPTARLQVEDLFNNSELLLSANDIPGTGHSPTMTIMRKNSDHVQLAKYGFTLDAVDGNKLKILYGTTGAFTTTSLTIDTAGSVGIGTSSPDARLQVAGNGHFTGNVTVDGIINAKYQDVAEWVPSEGTLPPGTVVVLNRLKTNAVAPSAKAYDTAVAGVVSDQPGVLLGVAGENKAKIATTGRVKVHVDARTHAVNIGDLLVTSDLPGTAMLSEPLDINGRKFHQPGTIIGKALEPLANGEGEILVLLSLQ
jgi:hypothetical protein